MGFRGIGFSPFPAGEADAPEAKAVPFEEEALSFNVARKASVSGLENNVCDFLANFSAPAISPSAFFRRAIFNALDILASFPIVDYGEIRGRLPQRFLSV